MKHIFFFTNNTAQDFHRTFLPVKNIHVEDIELTIGVEPQQHYDAYVIPRCPCRAIADKLPHLVGRLIWSIDDDFWHLPDWNPAKHYTDMDVVNWLKESANEIWTSTDRLQEVVGRGVVLPNLIDTSYFPVAERVVNDPLRILWQGSAYHEPDMELVSHVFGKLLRKYGDKIQCLYFGSMPTCDGEWIRIPGSNVARLVPKVKGIGLVEPVVIEQFGSTLVAINADIGLCALTDEEFSHSKSNLKWLEYSMCGTATVSSDITPYHGCGLVGDLYENCCTLVENKTMRESLGCAAKDEIMDNWTWTSWRKNLWIDAIRAVLV